MEILNDFRKEEIRKEILPCTIKIVLACLLFYYGGLGNFLFGPTEIREIQVVNLENRYISYNIAYNYGAFVEYSETSSSGQASVFKEYIITAKNDYYMAVLVPNSNYDIFDKQMEETYAYLEGESSVRPTTILVSGVVRRMNDKELEFYYEMFGEFASDNDYVLPYVLDTRKITPLIGSKGISYIMFLLAGILILHSVYRVIRCFNSKNHKTLLQYLQKHPSEQEAIYKFYYETEYVNKFKMNKEYFIYHKVGDTFFCKASDIVWAYQRITSHTRNGLPRGKSFGLVVADKFYARFHMAMKTEKLCADTMNYFKEINPSIVIGYSEELEDLYIDNMDEFVKVQNESNSQ